MSQIICHKIYEKWFLIQFVWWICLLPIQAKQDITTLFKLHDCTVVMFQRLSESMFLRWQDLAFTAIWPLYTCSKHCILIASCTFVEMTRKRIQIPHYLDWKWHHACHTFTWISCIPWYCSTQKTCLWKWWIINEVSLAVKSLANNCKTCLDGIYVHLCKVFCKKTIIKLELSSCSDNNKKLYSVIGTIFVTCDYKVSVKKTWLIDL